METFVVRIWVPAESDDGYHAERRGFVTHSASGRTRRFEGPDELLELLEPRGGGFDGSPEYDDAAHLGIGAANPSESRSSRERPPEQRPGERRDGDAE